MVIGLYFWSSPCKLSQLIRERKGSLEDLEGLSDFSRFSKPDQMSHYRMEWKADDLPGAVLMGFSYVEKQDQIVGMVTANPPLVQQIVIQMGDEVIFDYIPEGIGMLRTAYLKFSPNNRSNEIRFVSQEGSVDLRLFLT